MSENPMRQTVERLLTSLFDGRDEVERVAEANGNMACAMAWDHGAAMSRKGCCYCDWVLAQATKEDLCAHVERDCPNHPMRALERRIAELEQAAKR